MKQVVIGTCAFLCGTIIAGMIIARTAPFEQTYRLEDGTQVRCLVSQRQFSASLSCDWQHARKAKR